jgi:trans-aconitate methyltransferase
MQLLLGALPESERSYLTLAKPTVLHWGCGFGDGADEIRRAFPSTSVRGLDFAHSAIEQAAATYPEIEFLMSSEAVCGCA